MKLYSIKNTQTDRFNPPFVARDDDDAIETCRKAIIAGRDISLLVELDNLELHRVGSFDASTGEFNQQFVGDDFYPLSTGLKLDEIPLPAHIQGLIEKLRGFESVNLYADLKEVKE